MTNQYKGKIAVLIEEHFDPTEFKKFNEYFPSKGYQVDYISHLWGQPSLTFGSNPENDKVECHVTVEKEVNNLNLNDYVAIICIGAYAMDRLRYQAKVKAGQVNSAPAVELMRKIFAIKKMKVGAICHGLWLLCAAPELLLKRKVTCAHNIICDVENAGATIIYEDDHVKEVVIDDELITCSHPNSLAKFMETFVKEIENAAQ